MRPLQILARPNRLAPTRALSRRYFSFTRPAQATYGFIGLGRMGYPMAKNLRLKLPKEDTFIVQDANKAAAEKFAAEHSDQNVKVADTVRDVAESSDTIITCLPEPQHVRAVFKSILVPQTLPKPSSGAERLFIDTSTIDIITSRDVAASTAGQGKFIDAPMSGGVVGAEAGTLTFMIGASDDLVGRASEILLKMGKKVLHMGQQGNGLAGKLANNYLLALNNIATAEAMSMGIAWGLDPKALAGMINISTGKCWPAEVNNPVPGVVPTAPASRGYEGGFGVALMNKDLRLAVTAAEEVGVKLALGTKAREVYSGAETREDCKGKDFSVVYRYLGGKEGD